MGMSNSFLFVFLCSLVLVLLVQAQDQSGFISISCGIPAKSTFTDKTTGINYISDAKFISSGVSKEVTSDLKTEYQQQLWNLRSFPEGTRNCYRINITSGSKYLIRAVFLYGNYDGQNELPTFDLHLGPNLWETVKITNESFSKNPEIIHVPSLDYLHICLVNTGSGTPFISAIEIRTLKNTTYVTEFGSLSKYMRLNLGSTNNESYRYSDDVYDRFWSYNVYIKEWTQLSASLSADSLSQNNYQPPAVVMSTAATPVNASAPMLVWWKPEDPKDQFYVYMHFTELQVLQMNETRSFNITVNDELFYDNVVPEYQSTLTIYSTSATSGEKIRLLLEMTENSTLPPILNAIEVYTVKELSQSETDQGDVDAITTIKSTYGVTRNWQGDPCGPIAYIWNGLNCTYNSESSPRITTLDLSSSGLTGQIDASISKLTMLEKLDLSNNSLTGPVPDFLSQLQNLKILNLENNNFTGFVPSDLVEKTNKGSLSLSVGQNPYLCESDPCNKKTKKKNIVVPVAASVGGVVILLAAVTTIFCILKKKTSQAAVTIEPVSTVSNVTSRRQFEKAEKQNDASLKVRNRQYSYSVSLKLPTTSVQFWVKVGLEQFIWDILMKLQLQ